MGIKDLFKYLYEVDVFEPLPIIPSNSYILTDFNSYFYSAMYHIRSEEDIPTFPSIVADKLHKFKDNKTIFFIDRGSIKPKEQERESRRRKEAREIDIKILENRTQHENTSLDILECDISVNHYPDTDHQCFTEDIVNILQETCKPVVVYSYNFDAEYDMVLIGKQLHSLGHTNIVYASNDQDMIALSIINTPSAYMIYNASSMTSISTFRVKQEPHVIKFCQLVSFVTLLCNKSDYFTGLEQITAKTFLNTHFEPYEYDIFNQALSSEVLEVNDRLMRDIINAIKVQSCKPQYMVDENYTDYFCYYLQRVCKYLSLNPLFFTD